VYTKDILTLTIMVLSITAVIIMVDRSNSAFARSINYSSKVCNGARKRTPSFTLHTYQAPYLNPKKIFYKDRY